MNKVAVIAVSLCDNELLQYQKYLITKISEECCNTIIISDNNLETSDVAWCEMKDIIVWRETAENDVLAWKKVLCYLVKNNFLKDIEQLFLINDSVFGPIFPINIICEKMKKKQLDFWGITEHGEIPKKNKATYPRFLQRYFLVINNSLLNTSCFSSFWKKLSEKDCIDSPEHNFEYIFTEYFQTRGFHWEALCKTRDWEAPEAKRFVSFFLFAPMRLLREYQIPFVSKFLLHVPREVELSYNLGNQMKQVMKYIRENTDYDENYIWEYAIKKLNVYDLWSKFENMFILPMEKCEISSEKRKVALVVHLFYEDLFVNSFEYLRNVPDYIDVLITTSDSRKKDILLKICEEQRIRNYSIIVVSPRGREWSAFLVYAKKYLQNYDYIGFVHDKKSKQMYYPTEGDNFHNYLWDNMLADYTYIDNIFSLFENNSKLGLLCPPAIYFGEFWGHSVDFWTICYEGTENLAKQLKLNCMIEKDKPILTIGSCFWARKKALEKLLDYEFSLDDFENEPLPIDGSTNHCLERIIAFVVQDAGYFLGTIENRDYVINDYFNLRYGSQKMMKRLSSYKNFDSTTLFSTIESL